MAGYREGVAGGLHGGRHLRGEPAHRAEPRAPAAVGGHHRPLLSQQHSVIPPLQGTHFYLRFPQ